MRNAIILFVLTLAAGCNFIFGLEETVPAQPNFYTCDCECSSNVVAPGATLFTSPGGLAVGIVPNDATGTVVDGPMEATVGGTTAIWFRLRFPGLEGWARQDLIALAGILPIFAKTPSVCLPADFNPDLGGTPNPTISQLQTLCSDDVVPEASAVFRARFDFPVFCSCLADNLLTDTDSDSSCGVPCVDGDVCLVAGTDPPEPTPEPFSAALFQPTSDCDVRGPGILVADGHTPKEQPTLNGVLHVHGRACRAGEPCNLGLSYELTSSDIEFDSGTIFASDPKFVDIGMIGATEPGVIDMGLLLGFFIGEVPAGSAYSTVHARRSGQPAGFVAEGRNNAGLALAVNWEAQACRIGGEILGQARGDGDEGSFDGSLDVGLEGPMTNQPPRPNPGPDRTVECTTADATEVTLDASGSTDLDGDIALYEWRRGSDGAQLAVGTSAVVTTTQPLGAETYGLTVVDTHTAADGAILVVSAVDTTPPLVACNAPVTITPTDVPAGGDRLAITATATDGCTGVASVVVGSVACTRPTQCHVDSDGAVLTIRDSGGVGNVITWVVTATDAAGNTNTTKCGVSVVRPR